MKAQLKAFLVVNAVYAVFGKLGAIFILFSPQIRSSYFKSLKML